MTREHVTAQRMKPMALPSFSVRTLALAQAFMAMNLARAVS